MGEDEVLLNSYKKNTFIHNYAEIIQPYKYPGISVWPHFSSINNFPVYVNKYL